MIELRQAVMVGQGKVECRGQMVDVYLNDRAYWRVVPFEVWEYRLGRHQIRKEGLSYRGSKELRRQLCVSEVARHVADVFRVVEN